jgi:hypothetical protein
MYHIKIARITTMLRATLLLAELQDMSPEKSQHISYIGHLKSLITTGEQ